MTFAPLNRRPLHVLLAAALPFALIAALFAGDEPARAATATTATDNGLLSTTPAIPVLSRDCGLSTKLSDGNSLWVFCDSFYTSNTGALHAVQSNTAAFASPWTPTTMVDETYNFYGESILNADATQPGGRSFITLPGAPINFPCSSGVRKAWPRGVTTVPGGGTNGSDRVLIFYARICDQTLTSGANSYVNNGVGLAAYDYRAGSFNPAVGLSTPTVATSLLNDTLFGPSTPWGSGATTSTDGSTIYVYRCDTSCYTGKVSVANAATTSSYLWWNGLTWGSVATAMTMPTDSVPVSQFTVQWMPQITSWVMAYTPCTQSCMVALTDEVAIRTAASPQGPWSNPTTVLLPGCTTDATLTPCSAAAGHVESSGTSLTISYSRRNEGAPPPGRVHTASVPFAALNPLALDANVGPVTNQTSATLTFGVPGATGLTYECSRDGATYGACTSPRIFTGFASGAHSVSVRSVDRKGHRSAAQKRSWTVDVTAPTTSTTTQPSSPTTSNDASFTFAGTDDTTPAAELRFECSIDGAAATPCVTPLALHGIAPGGHAFWVRSVDRAGNRSATSTTTWTVTPVFTSPDPPVATLGVPYTHTFTVNAPAGTAVSYTVLTGALPPGISLSSNGSLSGTPTTSGTFGPVTVVATAPYGTTSTTFSIAVDAAIAGTARGQLHLEAATGIRVQAFNSSGLIVATVYTGTDGTYQIGGIAPGAYRLSFYDPAGGYTTQYWSGASTLGAATLLTVTAGQTTTADISLEPLTTISGHLTDVSNSTAIPNAWVTLYDGTGAAISLASTGPDGSYRFASLKPGAYRLGFSDSANAHIPSYWNNASSLTTATTLDASGGTITADASLTPYATITGTITDQVTSAPLAGIRVGLYNSAGSAIAMTNTAADGTYRFGTLAPAAYRVAFTDTTGGHAIEYWTGATSLATATVINATGGVNVANESLEPLTTIGGAVTDARTNTALAGIWVTLYDSSGNALALASTASDGSYRFANLHLGSYRVGFKDPNGLHASQWWQGATSLATATTITATGGTVVVTVAM